MIKKVWIRSKAKDYGFNLMHGLWSLSTSKETQIFFKKTTQVADFSPNNREVLAVKKS